MSNGASLECAAIDRYIDGRRQRGRLKAIAIRFSPETPSRGSLSAILYPAMNCSLFDVHSLFGSAWSVGTLPNSREMASGHAAQTAVAYQDEIARIRVLWGPCPKAYVPTSPRRFRPQGSADRLDIDPNAVSRPLAV